jgi:hypothetical protein
MEIFRIKLENFEDLYFTIGIFKSFLWSVKFNQKKVKLSL